MRVGYLYNLHAYPPKGGNHTHVLELVRGFLQQGHEVAVMDDPTMPEVVNFPGDTDEAVEAFLKFCDVIYVRIDSRPLSSWEHLKSAMAWAQDKTPVVWEINSPADENLAFSWLGGRQAGTRESWLRWLKRWLHAARQKPAIIREEKVRRALAKRVDAAICVSSSMENYAKTDLGIEHSVAVPNGGPLIPEDEICSRRQQRTNDRFTVFYSGSAIYPWQGLDMLTRVIELAEKDAPDIRFVLAVNQRTDDLPEGANVEIKERIPRDEVLNEICGADACIALHPDWFWTPHGVHGSPTKLWEYMSCMTPVITSNRGQMAEMIEHGHNGLLTGDEPSEVLCQIIALRDDPELAKMIGRNGWHLVQERLNWTVVCRETLSIFHQSIQRRVLATTSDEPCSVQQT